MRQYIVVAGVVSSNQSGFGVVTNYINYAHAQPHKINDLHDFLAIKSAMNTDLRKQGINVTSEICILNIIPLNGEL